MPRKTQKRIGKQEPHRSDADGAPAANGSDNAAGSTLPVLAATTKHWPQEVKDTALKRIAAGEPVIQVATAMSEELKRKLSDALIYQWMAKVGIKPPNRKSSKTSSTGNAPEQQATKTRVHDAIIWLRQARKEFEKKTAVGQRKGYHLAMLALCDLEGNS